MALKTVTGKITGPDNTNKAAATVTITLSQPTVISGTQEVVPSVLKPVVAADGSYSASLQANNDMTPTGTYYSVLEVAADGAAYAFNIIVPQTAGPFVMSSIQTGVAPTASPSPGRLSTLTVDGAATFTAGPVTVTAGGLTVTGGGMTLGAGTSLTANVTQGAQTRILNIQPSSTSTATGAPGGSGVVHAPFGLEIADQGNFIDTIDPVAYFGYNAGGGGVKKIAAEPSLTYVIEADYNDGTAHKMEQYFEYFAPDGVLTFRPLFFQYDRSKAGSANRNAALVAANIMGNPLNVYLPDGTP